MFRYKGGNIVNEKGKVWDVSGAKDRENQNVQVWGRHNGINQRWTIAYCDTIKPEPTKGQLNPDFGIYVQRPFYIVTQLPSKRFVDMIGKNLVIKTPNGRRTQMWWFCQRTKTIKSSYNKRLSFDIQSAGRSQNL